MVFLCDLEESVFPAYRLISLKKIGSWMELPPRFLKGSGWKAAIDCDWEEETTVLCSNHQSSEVSLFYIPEIKRCTENEEAPSVAALKVALASNENIGNSNQILMTNYQIPKRSRSCSCLEFKVL